MCDRKERMKRRDPPSACEEVKRYSVIESTLTNRSLCFSIPNPAPTRTHVCAVAPLMSLSVLPCQSGLSESKGLFVSLTSTHCHYQRKEGHLFLSSFLFLLSFSLPPFQSYSLFPHSHSLSLYLLPLLTLLLPVPFILPFTLTFSLSGIIPSEKTRPKLHFFVP